MVGNDLLKNRYLKALIIELEHYKDLYNDLETIYIGGGTPSSLSHELLNELLESINRLIDVSKIKEFTIEANPNDINEEFVKIIKNHNINRISIGVQTLNDQLLKLLRRSHSQLDIINSINLLRENDILNISLDFIYGIPTQKLEDVIADLEFISNNRIPHISYYSLIIEDHTELKHLINKNVLVPITEELEEKFFKKIDKTMLENNYTRYETSNFAFQGFEAVHNSLYWDLEEYLGIGLNASSQYNQKRYINERFITKYIENMLKSNFTKQEEEFNPVMEYILLGLRKSKGIDINTFETRYKTGIFNKYPGLKKHLKNGLLELDGNNLRFTKKGQILANQVYMEII
jgi:oxygen-independent coproporphyrinogen-3 oxidase